MSGHLSPGLATRNDTQGAIRFTPDELKELVKSGQLTDDDVLKMHPADRATVNQMGYEGVADIAFGGVGASKLLSAIPALPGMVSKLPGMAMSAAKAALPILGYGAAGYGINAGKNMGIIPPELANVLQMGVGFKAMGGMSGGAAKAEATAATDIEKQMIAAGHPPELAARVAAAERAGVRVPRNDPPQMPAKPAVSNVTKSNTGADMMHQENMAREAGRGIDINRPEPGHNITNKVSLDELKQLVGQGVQGAQRVAVPKSNINSSITLEEMRQMLDHPTGVPTPVRYHGENGPELRRSIDGLKRKTSGVKRREPE